MASDKNCEIYNYLIYPNSHFKREYRFVYARLQDDLRIVK